ncbi:S1 RNA-binding domain-containing protein [Streptomyces sp. NRRL S-495]|uniref:S1 RNA-binding domain-containing protein n=1 Tax=Streptomyces sp. NRRL S-495 TaxID=1609133 RepID=UPI0005F9A21C|nr:S1 RNA-binding domain-containing protein [Streptomyces sp. NRRL S-495]KJY33282.1 30S ribosomal protein S1 [Streptomyces sp. NRRL S-495]
MNEVSDDQDVRSFLASINVGDLCDGVVTEVTRSQGAAVTLDGFPARPLGSVGPLDLPWGDARLDALEVGRRITAGVTTVDLAEGVVRLSMAAAAHPELWAFLKGLEQDEILSGTIAAIESFGVFVALDDGPAHPVFPGVGFITYPELAWQPFQAAADVVRIGQRVSCAFLQFDTWNGEARLSLRATQPDPFRDFAADNEVGGTLPGEVTRLIPFGAFVRVAEGVEGLVPLEEIASTPVEKPEDILRVGEDVTVVITGLDRERRRLLLSLRRALPGPAGSDH